MLNKYLDKFERAIEADHYTKVGETYRRVFAWE